MKFKSNFKGALLSFAEVCVLVGITLVSVVPFSCKVSTRGIQLLDGDYTPPKLDSYLVLDSKTIELTFSEQVKVTGTVVSPFVEGVSDSDEHSTTDELSPALAAAVDRKIYAVTSAVSELVHGFEFARLLSLYYRAYSEGNDETKMKVVRWFRAEYETKREAKEELGVNIIITDDDWYDYLKLFALFFRLAGYAGMMIMIDELVNIYKIPNSITRQYNYEKMLTMYNDTLQGKARYLGIIMGATPQAVDDKRRGVYSYEALRSRLAEGKFSREGARDMLAPVIRLEPLTAEEMLVLCEKLADMHASLYGYQRKTNVDDLTAFIKLEYGRIGADNNITPREVIRDFIELLDLMYQHPTMTMADLMQSDDFTYTKSEAVSDETEEDFAEFTI